MAYPSEYLQYLPAVLQSDPTIDAVLRSFQRVLTGLPPGTASDGAPPGIEQRLDAIHTYFLPGPTLSPDQCAPDEFLPWLAGWVATSLREDWDSQTRRCFIQKVARLYPRRGTPDCLRELLTFFLGDDQPAPVIEEDEARPYCFSVRLRLPTRDPLALMHLERIARAIIDREKPAHTYYELIIESPAMQIVDLPKAGGLLVGVNTMLGIAKLR